MSGDTRSPWVLKGFSNCKRVLISCCRMCRSLHQQFELILDDAPTGGQGRGNNANNKKKEARDTKAKYEAKVMESRKQERATYERKLQVSQATTSARRR